ncbi:hypothetical protein BDV93DRAFT_514321 [Ceratobasidium sp. AG-I]|nr:hypothetical protein BDV93DRAFT_514321 [Ceratobasidium sp. AG-I]
MTQAAGLRPSLVLILFIRGHSRAKPEPHCSYYGARSALPIDEALRQWDLARAVFATSFQIYLDAFSHFEIECSHFFDSDELDIVGPRLWSCINFDRLHHIDYVELWLERAGFYPLDVVKVDYFTRSQLSEALSPRISGWYTNGAPYTLKKLALSVPAADFSPQSENISQTRLIELFHSLENLHLSDLRVNWEPLACQNLVTLSLLTVAISSYTLRQVLAANTKLQDIRLMYLDITYDSTPSALPPVELRWLRTIHLEYSGSCKLLTMIAPGNLGLTFKMVDRLTINLDGMAGHDITTFCRRSHITKLHCNSQLALEHAITAESKIEVLYLEDISLGNPVYDLIVPPTNDDSESPPGHLQSRLPHLHLLYLTSCVLKNAEGLRRVVSACPIREIGIDGHCYADGKPLFGIDAFQDWLSHRIDVSVVVKMKETGYEPFGTLVSSGRSLISKGQLIPIAWISGLVVLAVTLDVVNVARSVSRSYSIGENLSQRYLELYEHFQNTGVFACLLVYSGWTYGETGILRLNIFGILTVYLEPPKWFQ